jgi:hypothetical protein
MSTLTAPSTLDAPSSILRAPPLPTATAPAIAVPAPAPPLFNYILGFLLIGLAWGFTTPFIRAAARNHKPKEHPVMLSRGVAGNPVKRTVYGAWFKVTDLLRDWRYAVPLVVNLTGSVWFFLLIGQAGEFLPLLKHCMEWWRSGLCKG